MWWMKGELDWARLVKATTYSTGQNIEMKLSRVWEYGCVWGFFYSHPPIPPNSHTFLIWVLSCTEVTNLHLRGSQLRMEWNASPFVFHKFVPVDLLMPLCPAPLL